jgi:hypothetical protein
MDPDARRSARRDHRRVTTVPDPVVVRPSELETLDRVAVVAVDAGGSIVGRAALSRLYGLRAEIQLELAPSTFIALALVDALECEARKRGVMRVELDAVALSDSLVAAVRRRRPVADELGTSHPYLTWPITLVNS